MMKPRSLVIAAAVLISALTVPPARAANGRWTPYGPPGGFLTSFAVHPSGRLFTVAEQSGLYASADGGRSWFWSGVGMGTERIRAVAVDPEDGDLYAVGQARAFRSTDQGRTWTVRAQGAFEPPALGVGDVLVVVPGAAPAAPDTLFLGRGTSFFRSPDGGATWQRLDFHPRTTIAAVLVDPTDEQSIFVGTLRESDPTTGLPLPGGLFHSADGGQTWSEVSQPTLPFPGAEPPFSYGIVQLAAAPTSPATLFALAGLLLYRSTDDGESWQSVAPVPPPVGAGYTDSVVVVPGSPDTLFSLQQLVSDDGFGHRGLFSSRDLGTTWTRVDDGTGPNGQLIVAPDGELYSLSVEGLAHGENGGAHWRPFWIGSQFCGRSDTFASGGLLRWSRDASQLYSLVGFRLFRSNDGGRRWITRSQSLSESCVKLTDVQIDSDALFITTDAGVYRSDNGGVSWTGTAPPGQPEEVRAFHTLAIVQGGLVGGACGVERSIDGGRTWQETLSCDVLHPEFGDPEFIRFVSRLRVDPKRPQVVYAEVAEEGERHPPVFLPYVYRSTDGGRTWRRLSAGATLVAVDPHMTRTLYLVKNGRLLRSLNDGRTWKALGSLPAGSAYDLLVDRADSRTLYAAGTFGVARSTDGGATWSPFNSGLRALSVLNLFRDPRRPVLYAGAEGLFQIDVP